MKIVFFCVLAIVAIFIGPASALVIPKYGFFERPGSNRGENPNPGEIASSDLEIPQGLAMGKRILTKWPINDITWRINKYSTISQLSHAEQKDALKRSFARWSEVSPLVFQETSSEADINISFDRKGDFSTFDISGSLALAGLPPRGDIHFNDYLNWTTGNQTGGYDLETVATHSIGHALGLSHNNNPSSVMSVFYQKRPANFKLHPDDIASIQAIYGILYEEHTPSEF